MKFDIITIGTATRDAFIKSKDFHVDPDHHVLGGKALVMPLGAKLEIPDIYFSTGGGATNAAVTFARQGFRAATIAMVGDDVSGTTIKKDLAKEGVSTAFICVSKKPTAYSVLLEPLSGERTVLVYRGASELLKPRDIEWDTLKAKWLYISSLAGNIPLLARLIAHAKKQGIQIAYNPGGKELLQKEKLMPFLKSVHVLIANREEAVLITDVHHEDERELFQKWDALSPGINVLTDARKGVSVSDGRIFYHAGIFSEKQVVDRTGAGDAFGSGFVSSLIAHPDDIGRAIRLGSANATAKVEGMGAKYGLLTAHAFESAKRWRTLPIRTEELAVQ